VLAGHRENLVAGIVADTLRIRELERVDAIKTPAFRSSVAVGAM